MNPSNDTSRDDTLDPSQEDGVRPVSTEADPMTADSPGTRPNELPPRRDSASHESARSRHVS